LLFNSARSDAWIKQAGGATRTGYCRSPVFFGPRCIASAVHSRLEVHRPPTSVIRVLAVDVEVIYSVVCCRLLKTNYLPYIAGAFAGVVKVFFGVYTGCATILHTI